MSTRGLNRRLERIGGSDDQFLQYRLAVLSSLKYPDDQIPDALSKELKKLRSFPKVKKGIAEFCAAFSD